MSQEPAGPLHPSFLELDRLFLATQGQGRAAEPWAAHCRDCVHCQRYLQDLQAPTGCGTGGKADCWPCLRKGAALQNAIAAIAQRGGAPAAAP